MHTWWESILGLKVKAVQIKSTTALLLLFGGLILLGLGLVGEYVGRVFMCVNATPQYVEREVLGGAPRQ